MVLPTLLHAGVALLPVLAFLGLLLMFDSYKLLRPRLVLTVLAAGAAMTGLSWLASQVLLGRQGWSVATYSGWAAPLVEELLKGLVIAVLVRGHRIGFLVDAAILGFAVGSGFALVENLAYLRLLREAELSTWIVRGFGTAVMHGGATAMLAVIALAVLERRPQAGLAALLPGGLLAAGLHAAFNQLAEWPQLAMATMLMGVPALLALVFHVSERGLARWLQQGFDADAGLLAALRSGRFDELHAGHYIEQLQHTLSPTMAADAMRYLRLYTELSLRAKGQLMLQEHALPVPALDDATKARLDELQRLEQRLGRSGLRALRPLLPMRRKQLWQLNLLQTG